VPDITVMTEKGECLVEITVTHPTKNDKDKMKKIEKLGLPVIEVDLKKYKDSEISRDELRKVLIESIEDKEFIYYPLKKEAKEKIEEKATEHYYRHEKLKKFIDYNQNEFFSKDEIEESVDMLEFDSNNYTLDLFYQNENHVVDKRNKRLLLCTSCNQIYSEDDMSSYGGEDSMNKGICEECSRRKSMDKME